MLMRRNPIEPLTWLREAENRVGVGTEIRKAALTAKYSHSRVDAGAAWPSPWFTYLTWGTGEFDGGHRVSTGKLINCQLVAHLHQHVTI